MKNTESGRTFHMKKNYGNLEIWNAIFSKVINWQMLYYSSIYVLKLLFFVRGVITADELRDELSMPNLSPSSQTTSLSTEIEDRYVTESTTAITITTNAVTTTPSPTTSSPLPFTTTIPSPTTSTTMKPEPVMLYFPHHPNHPQYEEYQKNPFYNIRTNPASTTAKPIKTTPPKVISKPIYPKKVYKPQRDQPALDTSPIPNYSAWELLTNGDPLLILLIIASILW